MAPGEAGSARELPRPWLSLWRNALLMLPDSGFFLCLQSQKQNKSIQAGTGLSTEDIPPKTTHRTMGRDTEAPRLQTDPGVEECLQYSEVIINYKS